MNFPALGSKHTYFFLAVAVAWITWIEIRPSLRRWWHKRKKPVLEFVVHDDYPCLNIEILLKEQGGYSSRNTRRVGIKNNSNQTIDDVRLRLEAIRPADKNEISLDPHLPAAMRRFNNPQLETATLHRDETEYWDVVKWLKESDKKYSARFYICCFEEGKRHNIPVAIYRADLAVYAENMSSIRESFAFGDDGCTVFMRWSDWLNKLTKTADHSDFEASTSDLQAEPNGSRQQPNIEQKTQP